MWLASNRSDATGRSHLRSMAIQILRGGNMQSLRTNNTLIVLAAIVLTAAPSSASPGAPTNGWGGEDE